MVDKVGTSMVTSSSIDAEWCNKTVKEVDNKRRIQLFYYQSRNTNT